MTSPLVGRQAVVVGAGMAGLPAARALADFFEHVVVLERDTLPLDASHRMGTPQAWHTHALLRGGQQALGELFPGFEQDLAAAGAVPLTVGLDVRLERPGYDPFPARDLGWVAHAMSRPLVEFTVRRRVEQHANITIRERCRARDLVASREGGAVSAIRFESSHGRSETLTADLIVEASGRGNLTFGFLKSIGRPQPEETSIGVDITYATGVFAADDAPADWKGVMTFDAPDQGGLGGILLPLEGNRWIVTLAGRHGAKPPDDRDGFLACAQQLRTPTIYNAIKKAEQLRKIARFGFPASARRHFDQLEEFPRGLLPFGDAICRFNPVYGQGMSVAAQEASLLHGLLQRHANDSNTLSGLASAFSSEAATLIETPWALAAVPDLAHPKAEGKRPEDLEQRLAFSEALNHLAAEDPAVHKLLFEVLHLLKPRSALGEPDLVERVKAVAAQA
jgi:2-polyprenyl-6-methoxyphenol hydroxylase-like FAD-dependent oxidoreductase